MPIHRVYAHEKVEADHGRVSLMRGPMIYCVEAADHPSTDVLTMALPRDAVLRAAYRDELLGGVTVLQGKAINDRQKTVDLTAIPYYAWANRDRGAMAIWINETPVVTTVKPAGKTP